MEIDSSALVAELTNLISEYHKAVNAGDERTADGLLEKIEKLVPNSDFNDLMFYGEIERTDEELIKEAVVREGIYQKNGKLALLKYIRDQMEEAMRTKNQGSIYCINAVSKFDKIKKEISDIN